MSAIRLPGKINEHTTLIDTGMWAYGITAVYLIQGTKKCLIDSGDRLLVPHIVKDLKALNAFPPDLIIVTHPHYDHAQGIPLLREEASRQGKEIQVLASHKAVPLLADASFNKDFGDEPYESIRDVTPVKEGDTIDLGGVTLRIYEVPGHCEGHIAILDEESRNIFVGDSIGYKFSDTFFLPPFMPPTWNPDAFQTSVNKLREIPFESLCLAHFGYIYGDEAHSILDEAVTTWHTWWQWYEKHADRLDNIDYLLKAMRAELNPKLPIIRPVPLWQKLMFPLLNFFGGITGRRDAIIDKMFLSGFIQWLSTGFKQYKSTL